MTVRGQGWYADPQDATRLRWWDGSRWGEHTLDPRLQPATAPSLPGWWRGVAVATQVSLLLCAAGAAFTLYVDQEILRFVDEVRLRPDTVSVADGERIDRLIAWSVVEVAPTLLTTVLFIVWLYTAHHSARMDRTAMEHASGWAIGGWFVPVLNLWRPFQLVSDVRRGATGDRQVGVPLRQGWWWGAWLGSFVLERVAAHQFRRAERLPDDELDSYVDLFASGASVERVACVLTIVAAVVGVFLVRELTARVLAVPQPA